MMMVTASLLAGTASGVPGAGNREPGIDARVQTQAVNRPADQSVVGTTPGSRLPAPRSRGDDLTIYLMTMGQGDQVWERFGHNAIRIVDAAQGTDSVYNWGTFDFDQPNFLSRFLTGNTLYWMQGDGLAETLDTYRYLNRSVWVQELDLTPAERVAVREFIAWNALPENRYYRYDYYLDNCSTRVRDLIDRVIGGQLRASTASRLTNTSYRFHTQRLLQFDGAVAFGTNIGLGEVADRPISAWEEAFLPGRLQEHIRGIQLRAEDGSSRSLVKSEQQLFAAQRAPEPEAPPDHTLRNLLIGLALAASLAALARAARGGRRVARIAFTALATAWAALGGVLGVLFIVGWTATRHVFMARNENLLQLDPLSLALAAVLPLAVASGRAAGAARTLSAVIAAVAVAGFAMKLLPWFDQVNGEVIALTVPVHLALAWAVRVLVVHREPSPARKAAAARAAVASRSAA
jgi:hypothetical protein